MIQEKFADGDSVLHRLDPRVKILVALFLSIIVACGERLAPAVAGLLVTAGLVVFARMSMRAVLARLALVNGFMLLLWVVLPFSFPGEPVFTLGPLAATREGVERALLISVKSNAIILACIALLSSMTLVTLGHALCHLRVPMKITQLLLLTVRYFRVIQHEYVRLRNAMKVRCFRPRTNWHTYRSYAYLVGMLLVMSYERANRIRAAMLCRGFKGTFWLLDHFAMAGRDYAFLSVMVPVLALLGLLQWTRIIL